TEMVKRARTEFSGQTESVANGRTRGGNNSCCRKRRFTVCTSRKDLAEGIVHCEVRVVENIEEFSPEIQSPVLAQLLDVYIFSERKIEAKVAATRRCHWSDS